MVMQVLMDDDLHHKISILAAQRRLTIKDLIEKAVKEYYFKGGKNGKK